MNQPSSKHSMNSPVAQNGPALSDEAVDAKGACPRCGQRLPVRVLESAVRESAAEQTGLHAPVLGGAQGGDFLPHRRRAEQTAADAAVLRPALDVFLKVGQRQI